MAITVRSATPEDRDRILAISAQIWEEEDYVPLVLDHWLAEGGLVVAELDGAVAGFAKMTLLAPGEVWLEGLRVDPAHQGKGVAKAIAHHQLAAARALTPRSIRFATAEVNAESLHIARSQGFQEIARFTYVEGPVRDEPSTSDVHPVREVERAAAFLRLSPAYRAARGLLGWGWRFPELTPERLTELIAQGRAFGVGDPLEGLLILLPDPYAPETFASLAFLDGTEEAEDALLQFAHTWAREKGQGYVAAMVPREEDLPAFERNGLAPLPYFRYVLVLEYPVP